MEQYIPKTALVAEIEKRIKEYQSTGDDYWFPVIENLKVILSFINHFEVKEIGINISNIDDLLEEDGIDPYSKDAKLFKECYYAALERYKEKKGIV